MLKKLLQNSKNPFYPLNEKLPIKLNPKHKSQDHENYDETEAIKQGDLRWSIPPVFIESLNIQRVLNETKKRYHNHPTSLYSMELTLKMNDRASSFSPPIAEMITRERSSIVTPPGICQLINSFWEILSQINKWFDVVLICFEMNSCPVLGN